MKFNAQDIEEFQEVFSDQIIRLNDIPREKLPPIETRNAEVDQLLDTYLEVTGETPTKLDMKLLADYILAEDLKDTYRHKTSMTEYPLQSKYSKRNTPRREISVSGDILDYLHSKYHKRLDSLTKVSRLNKEEN